MVVGKRTYPDTAAGKRDAVEIYGDNWADYVDFDGSCAQQDDSFITESGIVNLFASCALSRTIVLTDTELSSIDQKRVELGLRRAFLPAVSYCGSEAELVSTAVRSPNFRDLPA